MWLLITSFVVFGGLAGVGGGFGLRAWDRLKVKQNQQRISAELSENL